MDKVSNAARSAIMAAVRGKDTAPERFVRSEVHKAGFRYRVHVRSLPGVTIQEQLFVENTPVYQTIHSAPPVQYYFNPARTKANQYPWLGIQQYGPFSKDTFPKRSPTIMVVFPDTAQGAAQTFLRYLRDGVTTNGRSP